jgi:hypothetical protein
LWEARSVDARYERLSRNVRAAAAISRKLWLSQHLTCEHFVEAARAEEASEPPVGMWTDLPVPSAPAVDAVAFEGRFFRVINRGVRGVEVVFAYGGSRGMEDTINITGITARLMLDLAKTNHLNDELVRKRCSLDWDDIVPLASVPASHKRVGASTP